MNSRIKTREDLALICGLAACRCCTFLLSMLHLPHAHRRQSIPTLHAAVFQSFYHLSEEESRLFYSAKELTVCYYYRSACTTEAAKHSLEKNRS